MPELFCDVTEWIPDIPFSLRSKVNSGMTKRRGVLLLHVTKRRDARPWPTLCILRGETYTLRHPGSELNEVKAMLSGIHSVTVRQCIDGAEDSGRESACCNEWMRQIPTAANDPGHSLRAPLESEFQDDEAAE